jgi:S-adenosylmethionine:tRNA-ribosyltransferase-isomerase (queuine synthetase)
MDQEFLLVKNLETQLKRLCNEIADLEDTKNEMELLEYQEMKAEFLDQSKEFTETLERMNKGDLSVINRVTVLKHELRNVIAKSFNTLEIIKIFGYKLEDELEKQLYSLNEDYKLKRIGKEEMEVKRLEILNKLKHQNEHKLTKEDLDFLESKSRQELSQLDSLE